LSFTVQDTVAADAGVAAHGTEEALAGQTLANRYDILDLVATGGMGAVYRARDRELDEIVALKVIRRELASLPSMTERFRHEVKLARRVTHVNVARTFELGTANGLMYCTMELVEGQSLARRIAQQGRLAIGEAVMIARAVCDGLRAAHAAGVIHRDIKPDNVLIANDGRVVVADFGVAAAGVSPEGELSGTPAYMAPEQARGEPATAASDVYAVGVMLFEMLTGRPPFGGTLVEVLEAKASCERVTTTSHDVPPALATVIGDATSRDPITRIARAASLHEALAPWANASPEAVAGSHAEPAVIGPSELTTIVVLAANGDVDHPKFYLATAVHEQVLARLTKKPRIRVLPRATHSDEPAAFELSFTVDDVLAVTLTREGLAPIRLSFPLALGQIDAAADAIAATVDAEITRTGAVDPQAEEALDMLLQARDIAYRDFTRVRGALEQLERAREIAPSNPRILANLAVGYIRAGFFMPAAFGDGLAKARLYATAAVTTAPDLADAHIACGHLELTSANPERAASHFRIAIALAPHLAEAHEQLGRMLLEAGYLEPALARLHEAIAISPNLRSANWEIARAYALDGRWDENERIISTLRSSGLDRPMSRARYAWWRRDWATLADLRSKLRELDRMLWPGVIDALLEIFLEHAPWSKQQDVLFGALRESSENRRRRVFIAQLSAEAAAFAGETAAVTSLIEHATNDGLFDLHWLDHCVMLATYREQPAFGAVRVRIAERAHQILDALYGDHEAALSATQMA
jgi:eukaryotic-like serine/threonine-protein kinase